MEKDKRKRLIDVLPLLLTTVIAISACFSAYFSYQTIKITREQKRIQSRQEIFGYVKAILDMANEYSKKTKDDKTVQIEGESDNLLKNAKDKIPNESLQTDPNH